MANRYFLNIGANWGDTANWSDTSGGTGGFSVPTNVDDVFFDANSGNCTVNASARVCLTLNFTGYTNTITMSNTITVSGNVTLAAGMGIAGASALIVDETSTLTSNGKTWSAPFTFSGTSKTFTLGDNWAISGQVNLSGTTATTINSNTLTSSGNLRTTTSATTSGTTNLSLTGGTWSNISTGSLRLNTTINGNITVSGTVYFSNATLNYSSGTVTVTGSTLNLTGTVTMNTNTLQWNNFTTGNPATTLTLSSDLNIGGEWNQDISGTSVNGSFNINAFGGIFAQVGASYGSGSPVLNIKGGTWRGTGTQGITTNLDGNINITLSGGGFNGGTRTLTYVSGNVTCTQTSVVFFGGNINVSQVFFANANIGTATLLADLNIGGSINSTGFTVNGVGYNLNVYNGITVSSTSMGGTANINVLGGNLNIGGANGALNANVFLNGNINIISYSQSGGSITYLGGKVTGDLYSLTISGSAINFDKVNLRRVNITANQTLTMNRFFNGTASIPARVQCATATGTYTVAFQDTFEKIANNVKVSGCIVQNRDQLIVNGANSNKGLNTGIRFGNQSPNGLPKNTPTIKTETIFGIGNISEPTMVIS
jgi:hypothetical protein